MSGVSLFDLEHLLARWAQLLGFQRCLILVELLQFRGELLSRRPLVGLELSEHARR
jgi:hypothetical protein